MGRSVGTRGVLPIRVPRLPPPGDLRKRSIGTQICRPLRPWNGPKTACAHRSEIDR